MRIVDDDWFIVSGHCGRPHSASCFPSCVQTAAHFIVGEYNANESGAALIVFSGFINFCTYLSFYFYSYHLENKHLVLTAPISPPASLPL